MKACPPQRKMIGDESLRKFLQKKQIDLYHKTFTIESKTMDGTELTDIEKETLKEIKDHLNSINAIIEFCMNRGRF